VLSSWALIWVKRILVSACLAGFRSGFRSYGRIALAENRRYLTTSTAPVDVLTLLRKMSNSPLVCWYRERAAGAGRRMRTVMVVALARKLLIALWRFATDGVVPEGAVLKPQT